MAKVFLEVSLILVVTLVLVLVIFLALWIITSMWLSNWSFLVSVSVVKWSRHWPDKQEDGFFPHSAILKNLFDDSSPKARW